MPARGELSSGELKLNLNLEVHRIKQQRKVYGASKQRTDGELYTHQSNVRDDHVSMAMPVMDKGDSDTSAALQTCWKPHISAIARTLSNQSDCNLVLQVFDQSDCSL